MQLKSIEIQGFKSFAGKTRLDFDTGMTAVIGPNGSGKSNLAEAIRWVLGEQSTKQLRSKSSTDIIFAGSDSKQQASRAVVRLTFDNETGRFPVDAAEVSVARSLSRAGESEYSVNGDPVRLVDLQHLLAEAGIGAKTYTVISQGMVDRYLSATPTVRRELFDEATGIRAMQIKLHEADKKLRSAQHNAHDIEVVTHELEPRLAVLGRQIQRHNERQQLESVFTEKQTAWFQHAWHEFSHAHQAAKARYEELQSRIATARTMRQALEQRLLSTPHSSSNAEILEEKLRQARKEYELLKQEQAHAVEQKEQLAASLVAIRTQRETAKRSLEEKRGQSLHFDWLKATRQLLRRTQDTLRSIISSEPPSEEEIKTLVDDIDTTINRTDDSMSVHMARSVLDQLEKPLQEVARLTAIEEERTSQLKNLRIPPTPTSEAIAQLEQQLRTTAPAPGASAVSPEELEAAREEELEAERESAAAKAAAQQTGQDLHGLEQEILRERGTEFIRSIQEALPSTPKPSETDIRQLASRISQLGTIDELTIKEYEEVKNRYDYLTHQLEDIRATEQNIETLRSQLKREMDELFTRQFQVIQRAFCTYFQTLFGGGKADLTVTEEGIEIKAVPPGKHTRSITLLSGGERALTSLALLLAILEAQRPPFIVLDEVDAALDEANSKHLSEALQEKSRHTQCIVITHNRQTMSGADVLYGVTMQQDGVSKIYSVSLKDIEEKAEELAVKEHMAV
ncbi:MAG: AAA family ATPase [Candidatus Andersenbacteria bacterium]